MIENKYVLSDSEDATMRKIYENIKDIKKILKKYDDSKKSAKNGKIFLKIYEKINVLNKNKRKNKNDQVKLEKFKVEIQKAYRSCEDVVDKGKVLYKSRIYDESDKYEKVKNIDLSKKFRAYLAKDSFVNPNAPENRMNKAGTKCLYLSSDIPTSIIEVGASNNDSISVSEVICKEDLYIINLSKYWGYGDTREESLFSLQIQNSANLDDKESKYLFPQYIADICRKMGYDGIAYASKYVDMNVPNEKHMGINYAIFNYDKCEVISTDFYQVSDRSFVLRRLSDSNTEIIKL